MWPFEKKIEPRSSVQLTDEERSEVQRAFDMFKKPSGEVFVVKEELKEEFDREVIAEALYHYATHQLRLSDYDSGKAKREVLIDKARASLLKATLVSTLPMYKYYLACCADQQGKPQEAINLFRNFLDEAKKFQPSKLQVLRAGILPDSLESAMKYAVERCGG